MRYFWDQCLTGQVAEQTVDLFSIYLFLASNILSAITDMICSHSNWIWSVREFEHERAISHILELSFVETLNIYFCPAITNFSVLMDIPCFQVIKAWPFMIHGHGWIENFVYSTLQARLIHLGTVPAFFVEQRHLASTWICYAIIFVFLCVSSRSRP